MNDWSPETLERARALIEAYPDPRSAIMPLLYVGMTEEGYVTENVMEVVADLTGVTAAQVQGVASFYTMFKTEPVGKYLVSVCTSLSCWLLGADDLLAEVEDATGVAAGETDQEGLLSVEHVECIGACGGAPALQVNYELVEGVAPDAGRRLCEWLRTARPEAVNTDEMQQLFGGRRSFDWGVTETTSAPSAVPSFGPLGNEVRS